MKKWFGEIAGEVDSLEYPFSSSTSGADGDGDFDGDGDNGVRIESSLLLFASTERKIQLCV